MIEGYIDIFMKDMLDVIQALSVAIDEGQMNMVEHQAHKVKNMAAESGGKRLHVFAESMEKAAVEGRRQECRLQLSKLKTEFDMLADAIKGQKW